MKKIAIMAVIAIACASCGTQKQATVNSSKSDSTLGTHLQKSPEQLFAEDSDRETMRGWGSYNGFGDQNLESFATAVARAQLADEVSTLVSNAIEIYQGSHRIDNKAVDGVAENAKMAESEAKQQIKAVSKELISGSRIAMSDRYAQKDGTVTCYSAVEISIKAILNNIRNKSQIQAAISDAQKAQIDLNSAKFAEAMQSSFEELKEAKQ